MDLLQLLDFDSLSLSRTAGILSALYVLYLVGVGVHRLFFSPYSKFPGSKLAGLTYGYMFYYDALGVKGQYIYKIQQLHEEYGALHVPIFRRAFALTASQRAQSSESVLTNCMSMIQISTTPSSQAPLPSATSHQPGPTPSAAETLRSAPSPTNDTACDATP